MHTSKAVGLVLQLVAVSSIGGCFYFASNPPLRFNSEGFALSDQYLQAASFSKRSRYVQSIDDYFSEETSDRDYKDAMREGKSIGPIASPLWFEGAKYCHWFSSDDYRWTRCFFEKDGQITVRKKESGDGYPREVSGKVVEFKLPKHGAELTRVDKVLLEKYRMFHLNEIQGYVYDLNREDLLTDVWIFLAILSLLSPVIFILGHTMTSPRRINR